MSADATVLTVRRCREAGLSGRPLSMREKTPAGQRPVARAVTSNDQRAWVSHGERARQPGKTSLRLIVFCGGVGSRNPTPRRSPARRVSTFRVRGQPRAPAFAKPNRADRSHCAVSATGRQHEAGRRLFRAPERHAERHLLTVSAASPAHRELHRNSSSPQLPLERFAAVSLDPHPFPVCLQRHGAVVIGPQNRRAEALVAAHHLRRRMPEGVVAAA